MRLLYLWIDNGGQFNRLSCNFSAEQRFTLEKNGGGWNLSVSRSNSTIPDGFFNVGRYKHVSDVSVIVGANASGKTSIARFLQEIRSSTDATTVDFRYVLVYEVAEKWHVQWWLGSDLQANEELSRSGCWPRGNDNVIECRAGSGCKRNDALWNFEFAYYTPHMTTENPFPANCPEMENLSTWGIMYGGFEEQIGRPYRYEDHRDIQRNYIAAERRMGLTALLHIPKSPNGVDLPEPKWIRICIHEVELHENLRWLDAQRIHLKNELEDEKTKRTGMAQWVLGKIDLLSQLKTIGHYAAKRNDYNEKDGKYAHNCRFALRAFAAYVLSCVRVSGVFEHSYNPLYAWYAERLLQIFSTIVQPKINDADSVDVQKIGKELLQALKDAIRLFKKPRPGTIAEDRYPDVLKRRVCLARLFEKLVDWSQVEQNREKDLHGTLDDVKVSVDDAVAVRDFYRDYEVALERYDFLEFRYDPVLASGEMCFLSMFGRLYDFWDRCESSRKLRVQAIQQKQKEALPASFKKRSFSNSVLLFLDEAETAFHPQWQKEIVKNVLLFYNCYDVDIDIHLVFATHSPILLSDIPSGNVIKLRRDHETGCTSVDTEHGDSTFAANIYDLYKDSFFLDHGTIGGFAASKVNGLLEKVNPPREKYKTDEDYWAALRTLKETIKISPDERKIAEMIGDPFISRYLHRRFDELEVDYDTPEDECNRAVNGDAL